MPMMSGDRVEIQVAVNGQLMQGLLRASVATTNCFSADTYCLKFGVDRSLLGDFGFWESVTSAYIEVTAVISSRFGPTYQSLITGMADTIHIDPIRGTVGVEGRDLSSSMIDAYSQRDFVNQTASEVISTIGQYHNLQPVVTPTAGNIGRYYGDGYTKLSLGQFSRVQSDWDLVVQLARQNDFDAFIEGRALYFQPSGALDSTPVLISSRDIIAARVERNLCVPTGTSVKVQSWNSQNMAAYDSSNLGTSGQIAGAADSSFLFSGSNYTSQQVADSAARYAAELSRLATILHLDMPLDLSLSPRAAIFFDGMDALFGMTYRIESIERHYSSTQGSTQMVRAVEI